MKAYIEPTDPEAFVDFTRKEPAYDYTKECPVCKGHGGWNIELNAYKMPNGYEDTPENRHLYVHYRASCSHCNGWGYVEESNNCPGHKWVFVRNLGRCYNLYKCAICGEEWEVDSSD